MAASVVVATANEWGSEGGMGEKVVGGDSIGFGWGRLGSPGLLVGRAEGNPPAGDGGMGEPKVGTKSLEAVGGNIPLV